MTNEELKERLSQILGENVDLYEPKPDGRKIQRIDAFEFGNRNKPSEKPKDNRIECVMKSFKEHSHYVPKNCSSGTGYSEYYSYEAILEDKDGNEHSVVRNVDVWFRPEDFVYYSFISAFIGLKEYRITNLKEMAVKFSKYYLGREEKGFEPKREPWAELKFVDSKVYDKLLRPWLNKDYRDGSLKKYWDGIEELKKQGEVIARVTGFEDVFRWADHTINGYPTTYHEIGYNDDADCNHVISKAMTLAYETDDFNRMNLNEIIYGAPYYVFVVFDWGDK